MFAKSALFSSLLALAMGKPIARRNSHLSNVGFSNVGFNVEPLVVHQAPSFDLNSVTVTGFNPEHFSFNNFGGLASLNNFDHFFGQGNFCGVQNVLVQQNVVTCQVTQVNIVQQHLAVISEFAKRVILTQSCETEAQVLLYTQFLGGLTNWGQTLRRVNGIAPTFDVSVANQIVNVVDVSGNINVHDFGFVGSNIGNHGVTVIGDNWVDHISPSTVGFVWEQAIRVIGPSIQIGVVSPHVSTNVVIGQGSTHELPPIHLPPVVVHESIPSHNSFPVVSVDSHVNSGIVLQKGESVGTVVSGVDIPSQTPSPIEIDEGVDSSAASTADVDIAAQRTADVDVAAQSTADVDIAAQSTGDIAVATGAADPAATAAVTDIAGVAVTPAVAATDAAGAAVTPAVPAASADPAAAAGAAVPQVSVQPSAAGVLNGRRLPKMVARRAWDSRHHA